MKRINEGRWSAVKTNMNWFKEFLNAEHRFDTISAKALAGYQRFCRDKRATDSTISNMSGFFTLGDVAGYEAEFASEKIFLLPIRTQANKVLVI